MTDRPGRCPAPGWNWSGRAAAIHPAHVVDRPRETRLRPPGLAAGRSGTAGASAGAAFCDRESVTTRRGNLIHHGVHRGIQRHRHRGADLLPVHHRHKRDDGLAPALRCGPRTLAGGTGISARSPGRGFRQRLHGGQQHAGFERLLQRAVRLEPAEPARLLAAPGTPAVSTTRTWRCRGLILMYWQSS